MEIIMVGVIISVLWWIVKALQEYTIYNNSYLRTNIDYHMLNGAQLLLLFIAFSIDMIETKVTLGVWLICYFIYEVLLAKLHYNEWFPRRCDYGLLHLYIEKRWTYDFIILCVGIYLLVSFI